MILPSTNISGESRGWLVTFRCHKRSIQSYLKLQPHIQCNTFFFPSQVWPIIGVGCGAYLLLNYSSYHLILCWNRQEGLDTGSVSSVSIMGIAVDHCQSLLFPWQSSTGHRHHLCVRLPNDYTSFGFTCGVFKSLLIGFLTWGSTLAWLLILPQLLLDEPSAHSL